MGALMLVTVPSHIVLASVPNGWPNTPQNVAAGDAGELPPERVWDAADDATKLELSRLPTRYYRVVDKLMVWTRIGTFPVANQASFVVYAQAQELYPLVTRLNRFLFALIASGLIVKAWRITCVANIWRSAALDADGGVLANRVRSQWPASWYPVTGFTGTPPNVVPTYDTAHPIIGALYAT